MLFIDCMEETNVSPFTPLLLKILTEITERKTTGIADHQKHHLFKEMQLFYTFLYKSNVIHRKMICIITCHCTVSFFLMTFKARISENGISRIEYEAYVLNIIKIQKKG